MLFFIIITLCILLLVMLNSDLKIRFNFVKYNEKSRIIIDLTGLFGILKYTRKFSTTDSTGKDENISTQNTDTKIKNGKDKPADRKSNFIYNAYNIEKMIDSYEKFYTRYEPYIKKIKKKSTLNNISWHTEIGTNDAAETAVTTGLIWTIKTFVVFFIAKNYNFSNILINVVPNYDVNTFKTTIDCIFNIKLGYIINTNIRTLLDR